MAPLQTLAARETSAASRLSWRLSRPSRPKWIELENEPGGGGPLIDTRVFEEYAAGRSTLAPRSRAAFDGYGQTRHGLAWCASRGTLRNVASSRQNGLRPATRMHPGQPSFGFGTSKPRHNRCNWTSSDWAEGCRAASRAVQRSRNMRCS